MDRIILYFTMPPGMLRLECDLVRFIKEELVKVREEPSSLCLVFLRNDRPGIPKQRAVAVPLAMALSSRRGENQALQCAPVLDK